MLAPVRYLLPKPGRSNAPEEYQKLSRQAVPVGEGSVNRIGGQLNLQMNRTKHNQAQAHSKCNAMNTENGGGRRDSSLYTNGSRLLHFVMQRIGHLPVLRQTYNRLSLTRYRHKSRRQLEIGPGTFRISGFETLNITGGPLVDYVADASLPLPLPDETYDLIYASHVLEHIPWFKTGDVLKEWVRKLKPNGKLELWVPDGLKIAEAFVFAETAQSRKWEEDNWFRFNETKDACVWAAGRFFTYGNGTTNIAHPNWHRAIFSPRWLELCLKQSGLVQVRRLSGNEIRGASHGWINLGYEGTKPGSRMDV